MKLSDNIFTVTVQERIETLIFNFFNEVQKNRIYEWMNTKLVRPEQQIIQLVLCKDNFESVVIFYTCTGTSGGERKDNNYITHIDTLGNIETFEDIRTIDYTLNDFKERREQWLQKLLSEQLSKNSETVLSIEKKNYRDWSF